MSDSPKAQSRTVASQDDHCELDVVAAAGSLFCRGWTWVVLWLLSRACMLHIWAGKYQFIANDVRYYHWQLGQGDYSVVLREYPLPVLWLLDALDWPGRGERELYVIVFAIAMALLDAVFALWLWKANSRTASVAWMAFGLAMGPLIWFRYDMVPGVIVGAAVLVLATQPRLSGALVALGAGIKLWPALLIAPLLGRDRPGRLRAVSFTIAGFSLALLALIGGGFTRLLSPLTWQSDRGLQVESVWATWQMGRRGLANDPSWTIEMSKYNAYEVFGPGVESWQHAGSIAMALAVAFAAGLALACLYGVRLSSADRAMAACAIIVWMIVGNKTLSPQYLVWLGAVATGWLAIARSDGERRRAGIAVVISLLLAWATQYVYPTTYAWLITNPVGLARPTLVLVGRNLGLVALCLLLTVWVLAAVHRGWPRTGQSVADKAV